MSRSHVHRSPHLSEARCCAAVRARLVYVAPVRGESSSSTRLRRRRNGRAVLARSTGGNWGYPSVHGWVNMGKDG
jgi:hypothetical protein